MWRQELHIHTDACVMLEVQSTHTLHEIPC